MQTKDEMVKIKFNAYITPQVIWNDAENKFVAKVMEKDFVHEYGKLMDEEGDTPDETKKLKKMHTRLWNIKRASDYIYGEINNQNTSQFFYKDQIVELPKKEANFYLGEYCGGIAQVYNGKELVSTPYKYNIDNRAGYYKKDEMARYHREHVALPLAELVA